MHVAAARPVAIKAVESRVISIVDFLNAIPSASRTRAMFVFEGPSHCLHDFSAHARLIYSGVVQVTVKNFDSRSISRGAGLESTCSHDCRSAR